MKKFLLIALAFCLAGVADAQIVSSNAKLVVETPKKPKKVSTSYNRIGIRYAGLNGSFSTTVNEAGTDDVIKALNEQIETAHGGELSYLRGILLTKKVPLYLEVGGQLTFTGASDNNVEMALAASIPVNVAYKYTTSSGFYIEPYAGVNFRVMLTADNIFDDRYETYYETTYVTGYYGTSYPMVTEHYRKVDPIGNRFLFGGEIGLNFGYKVLNINIGYQMFTALTSQQVGTDDFLRYSPRYLVAGIGFNF